ncbi:ATP-binding cassette domain-containing protein [Desulfotruncus alcoholivorax]|uniref:ATP-binding cassette domain-containing protein n=1 Tax=Desulfotruncus alcoholivorax TaxID=265477 RepID=UPI000420753B|nr:ABC transporter ATP-binding protein [Desulfotruncus alcoholivorax]
MPPIIEVKDLLQVIRKKSVFNGVSLEVQAGECFGLFGNKSAGKTALLHILAGIDRFTAGSVRIMGYDIRKTERFKSHLGLVTQERSLFQDLKVCENLDFIAALKKADSQNIRQVVEQLELQSYLNEPVETLDEGVYQRLALACALVNAPKLLLIDELIDGLDFHSYKLIAKAIKNYLSTGGTCLWAFHRVKFSAYMDRIGWLDKGEIIVYRPGELIKEYRNIFQINEKHKLLH